MLYILSASGRQRCQHWVGSPEGSAGLTGKGVIYEAEGSGRTFNARTHEWSPVGRSFKYRRYWSPGIHCQGRKCPWTGDSPWLTLPFTEQEPTRGDGRTMEWRPLLVKEAAGQRVSGEKVQIRIVLLRINTEPENRCWVNEGERVMSLKDTLGDPVGDLGGPSGRTWKPWAGKTCIRMLRGWWSLNYPNSIPLDGINFTWQLRGRVKLE